MATSTRNLLILSVGAVIALTGILGFVGLADQQYVLKHERTNDNVSQSTQVTKYELLLPERKAIFNQTVADGTYVSNRQFTMPEVVLRDGTYYHFTYFSRYDWLTPRTSFPVLVTLVGVGIAGVAVRRDISS